MLSSLMNRRRVCLELQAHRELKLTCWELTAEQAADGLITIIDRAARVPQTHVIEGVVSIDTELCEKRLMNREVLLQCQVGVEVVRTEYAVPPRIADLIQTRSREAIEGLLGQRHGGAMEGQPVVVRCIQSLNALPGMEALHS